MPECNLPKLAVFDVDGTLTQTMGLFDRCWVKAAAEVLGTDAISQEWGSYPHTTDSGILAHLFGEHRGRAPSAEETARTQALYMESLDEACTDAAELPGAAAFLDRLRRSGVWTIAIATGNWERAARLKLERAGFDLDGLPIATADDALSREEIVALAVARAGADFQRVVYLGDAVWDQRAARLLGMPFVGIGPRRFELSPSFPDYADPESVIEALLTAPVP